jgi:hypothetical protein
MNENNRETSTANINVNPSNPDNIKGFISSFPPPKVVEPTPIKTTNEKKD